jgi:hypothetical protein
MLLGAVGGGLAFRHWQRTWGATQDERVAALPGDELVPSPGLQATRAISIDTPPSAVFPWLVQLGWDKGGFYTYDRVERLIVKDMRNAAAIVPEWQSLDRGDPVFLADGFFLTVAEADPDHALVLFGADGGAQPVPVAFDFTWAFVVEPAADGGSRLVIRERYAWDRVRTGLMIRVVEWVSFAMTQKMLRTIKARAEGR